MQGLRNLLRHLGARPGGPAHFVVSDLREELVIYVNGWPYLRRELEMPAAALHHAGVPCMQAALCTAQGNTSAIAMSKSCMAQI